MSDAAARLRSISAESWQRLERVVDAALDAPASERPRIVAEQCGNDRSLRDAALAWLRACDDATSSEDGTPRPLDGTPAAWRAAALASRTGATTHDELTTADAALVGTRVGPWTLLAELGRGGMGTVYLAERADAELTMRAALKLLGRGGPVDPHGARRFREERRILATLAHPNIARLLDGGVTETGVPWFAMELVDGRPIDLWCDATALGIDGRLTLFGRVCDAVAHAHARLVVHRDLKPSNVLVTEEGDPTLLDFGIAKLLAPDGSDSDAGLTRPGAQPMTPAFAAPEQVRGESVSTATDVYALGALLHLLLCGTLPFGTERGSLGALERLILAGGAPRPSDVAMAGAGAVAAARATTPERLRRRLRGDLDTIVARAMHVEPARRYPTADALAADVRRHLRGMPVVARPDTVAYRARKLIGRHPLGVVAGAAATIALVAFSAVTATQAARLRTQAAHLAAERDKATEVTRFLSDLLSSADPYDAAAGHVPTLREVLDRGAAQATTSLRDRPEVRAHLLTAMAPAYFGLGEWRRAGELAEEAVTLRRGIRAPDLADALVYLAGVRLNEGRAVEAEAEAREALAILRSPDSPTDLDSARILSTLGAALQKQGRLTDAEPVLRALLAAERVRQPADPRAVANVARNLAHVLRDRHAYREAVPLYAEAYARHRATFGDEHPESANSAVNLGWALFLAGDTVRAEPLLRSGVATKRRILGMNHQDVAADQIALSRLLDARGAHAEAATLRGEAEQVLARVKR